MTVSLGELWLGSGDVPQEEVACPLYETLDADGEALLEAPLLNWKTRERPLELSVDVRCWVVPLLYKPERSSEFVAAFKELKGEGLFVEPLWLGEFVVDPERVCCPGLAPPLLSLLDRTAAAAFELLGL